MGGGGKTVGVQSARHERHYTIRHCGAHVQQQATNLSVAGKGWGQEGWGAGCDAGATTPSGTAVHTFSSRRPTWDGWGRGGGRRVEVQGVRRECHNATRHRSTHVQKQATNLTVEVEGVWGKEGWGARV